MIAEQVGRVHWLALGGTIQSLGEDPLDIDRYHLSGKMLSAGELITPVSDLVGEVTTEQFEHSPSHDMSVEDIMGLLAHIRAIRAVPAVRAPGAGCEPVGFVISCGSNAMEELAYLLWLLHDGPEPIIVTASMWPPTAVGSDALSNLVGAISAARLRPGHGGAASPSTPVRIVSDGAILHPVSAFKTHTSRRDAFSASAREIGTTWPGDVIAMAGPTSASPLAGLDLDRGLPRVDVVYSFLGADGAAIETAVERGAAGVVCAGMGAGFGTAAERTALRRALDAGVTVCQATRTPFGAVPEPARTVLDSRVLLSGTLTPQKTRLAVAVGLALGLDGVALQGLLDTQAHFSAHV